MSDAWRQGTPEQPSSQGSEEPPSQWAPDPSPTAAPGELARLVTPSSPADQTSPAAAQWAAAGETPPPPPAKKGPAWRGIAIRVGIIAAIVIAGLVLRDRLSGSATDLRVGDCFDQPAGTPDEISEVQHQPCTDPHDGEIFFVADYPDQDAYPGDAAIEAYIVEKCIPAWESYVARDYETDTEFDFSYLYPLPAGWTDGDHEISCYVTRVGGGKLTGSVKAAAAS